MRFLKTLALSGVLLGATALSAQAAVVGTLSFGTSGNSVVGDNIATGTVFTIEDLTAQPSVAGDNGTGVFANFVGSDIGPVTFNTAAGHGGSFSISNSVFGDFTSTSIIADVSKIGPHTYVDSIYILGTWTAGSGVSVTGPDAASLSFSLTQTNVGAISNSASFSVPPAEGAPEPSTWAMMALGFAGLGFAGYRTKRNGAAIA
jgi:hypothetical protein